MADISVTAADVNLVSSTGTQVATTGAAITAGQVCYIDSSGLAQLADADVDATTAGSGGLYIAIGDAASGQKVVLALPGPTTEVDIGATVAVGDVLVLSGTAGGIAPVADLASGDYVSVLGVCKTTTNLLFNPFASGFQIA